MYIFENDNSINSFDRLNNAVHHFNLFAKRINKVLNDPSLNELYAFRLIIMEYRFSTALDMKHF